jgi:hypothetical protein
MELGNDEQTLLFAGVGWLIAVSIWAVSLHSRAKTMLRLLSDMIDPEVWQAIGAPDTLKAALRDPERRWHRFVRSGEYLKRCDDASIALIDDYRRRTKVMLVVCAGSGLLLLIRFWPLLKPDFL